MRKQTETIYCDHCGKDLSNLFDTRISIQGGILQIRTATFSTVNGDFCNVECWVAEILDDTDKTINNFSWKRT